MLTTLSELLKFELGIIPIKKFYSIDIVTRMKIISCNRMLWPLISLSVIELLELELGNIPANKES